MFVDKFDTSFYYSNSVLQKITLVLKHGIQIMA